MLELILISIFLAVFIIFLSYNAGYVASISIIFVEFEDVPVFVIVLASFLCGILFSIVMVSAKQFKMYLKSRRVYKNYSPLSDDYIRNDNISNREAYVKSRINTENKMREERQEGEK